MIEPLWTGDNIAQFLNRKPRYVKEYLVHLPGFPDAIRLPVPGGGRSKPLYVPQEIRQWALKHKEK